MKTATAPRHPSSPIPHPSSLITQHLPHLAFPGRTSLLASEIATALRCDDYHINRHIAATPHKPAQYGTPTSAIRLPLARYHAWLWDLLLAGTHHHPRTLAETLEKLPLRPLDHLPEEIKAALPKDTHGRPHATLHPDEIPHLTGQSTREIYKELDAAHLLTLDIKSPHATRRTHRIPLDLAAAYILEGLHRGEAYTPCPREGRPDPRQATFADPTFN